MQSAAFFYSNRYESLAGQARTTLRGSMDIVPGDDTQPAAGK